MKRTNFIIGIIASTIVVYNNIIQLINNVIPNKFVIGSFLTALLFVSVYYVRNIDEIERGW